MTHIKYINDIRRIDSIPGELKSNLSIITDKYAFRANEYYLSLIDWSDPNDPIKNIIIPSEKELEPWGILDPCNEQTNYKAPGLQHKYYDTALFILNKTCGSFCRFCFRKRLFMPNSFEVVEDIEPGIEYIKKNQGITNILLTGGEPLLLSTNRLKTVFWHLLKIPHVRIIRIGTKIPVFNPFRILSDFSLTELLRNANEAGKKLYIMCHINHPGELSEYARKAIKTLQNAGCILCNQTPILKGINDNHTILRKLMEELTVLGVAPYYFFINRPTEGNKPFCVPIEKAFQLFSAAIHGLSGLSRRARLIMSHSSGKIEIVGMTERNIIFRMTRSRNIEEEDRISIFPRIENAQWYDDFLTLNPV